MNYCISIIYFHQIFRILEIVTKWLNTIVMNPILSNSDLMQAGCQQKQDKCMLNHVTIYSIPK